MYAAATGGIYMRKDAPEVEKSLRWSGLYTRAHYNRTYALRLNVSPRSGRLDMQGKRHQL